MLIMKRFLLLSIFTLAFALTVDAQNYTVNSPDGSLKVDFNCTGGKVFYSVSLNGKEFMKQSQLGLVTTVGDFSENLTPKDFKTEATAFIYDCKVLKRSHIDVSATRAVLSLYQNNRPAIDLVFMVKNNDLAFKYVVYPQPNPKSPTDPFACTFINN